MPQITIQAGAKLFVPDRADLDSAVQAGIAADRERELARGYKWMRLPENLQGKPSGSAIQLGVVKGQILGPEQGYAWNIRRLVVTGLTASSSAPDIVNFFLNDRFTGPIWWQLNGNQFGQTFSRGELIMMPGDTLSLQNSGSIASTSLVIVSGELEEVPAEMLYKVR